jgi:hypothetical protein
VKKKSIIQLLHSLNAGKNSICQTCRIENPDIANAVGPWLSCKQVNHGNGIAFVGKVARGDDMGVSVSDKLIDVGSIGINLIKENNWSYWAYTRDIMEKVYGSLDTALLHTSLTNLIKCNNSTTQDTSTSSQANNCIRNNNFIFKELELVSPKAVVFYTGREYDDYILNMKPEAAARFLDETDRDASISIGQKLLPWWSRKYYAADGTLLTCFLRIGHPERMNKLQYVEEVANWLKSSLTSHGPKKLVQWAP